MALFTWPFPKNPSAPPLLGIMALAVAAIAAALLVAGLLNLQVNLETREVSFETPEVNLQAPAVQAQDVESDRAALTAFFNSTRGSGWSNANQWNTSGPLSDWHGVTTNASGRVTGLALGSNNLTGSLPAELGNLSALQNLTLRDNALTGQIPPELGNLSNMTHLTLHNNQLTGSIPPELGQASSLTNLTLRNNQLTGTVPSELGSLTSMSSMDFNDNQLTGQLPLSLIALTQIDFLKFHNNAGLCAPLESAFQTWYQDIHENSREGDNCPRTRIRFATAAPVVGETVTVELTSQDDRLARIETTLTDYEANPCIGYDDTRNVDSGWVWERSSTNNGPWFKGNAGRQPHATFVYLPQAEDVGWYLRAYMTVDGTRYDTDVIGPVVTEHGVASGDQVSVAAPTGTVQVDNDLTVSLPAAAAAERHDPAINPRLESWQWERSLDGASDWENVTPYHKHCEAPGYQYSLTTDDATKHLRAYIYYNDDSSGSAVLKRAEAASVGPVSAP